MSASIINSYKTLRKSTSPSPPFFAKTTTSSSKKEGKRAFTMLKQALIEAPILQSPNWDLPLEIMCDASDYVVGAVLGQLLDKKPTAICYASKTLIEAQINYTTKEKELLHSREVPALHLGEQDHHLHWSSGPEVLALQERGQTMTDTMGAAPSRIRLGDKRQEGPRKLGGGPLIASPHLGRRGHRRYISRRAYPRHLD